MRGLSSATVVEADELDETFVGYYERRGWDDQGRLTIDRLTETGMVKLA